MTDRTSYAERVVYIPGDRIDRERWDRCIETSGNGNICVFSWFLDILSPGWGGLVKGDYVYVMPVTAGRRFGISYLLQPRFIQQCGIFGTPTPDTATVCMFLNALPNEIDVVDYHFNEQNRLPTGLDVEMRTNFLLKTGTGYEELVKGYHHNLLRKLKKSAHSGFHLIKNNHPEPLIQLFRKENGKRFSFLKEDDYRKLEMVIRAALHRDKAQVWSVYNKENILAAGAVWLFSHGRAMLYFTVQGKSESTADALAWLIDAFIKEHASSGIVVDFEGSIHPGLARFYGSFGSTAQYYPRLKINHLAPFLRLGYAIYRNLMKE